MYEGAKLLMSSRPQGLGSGLCDFAQVLTALMCVLSWIMVLLCMVQLGNQSLDRVQIAALRTCLGAFRTSLVASLHVEAETAPRTTTSTTVSTINL